VGGAMYDAPNQEVVRADGSGPGVLSTKAAQAPAGESAGAAAEDELTLDEMTKDELLDYAHEIGASPANASMTKDEIRDAIEQAEAEAGA
jgi:hypothetical protein